MKEKIDNLLASIRKNREEAKDLLEELESLRLDETTENEYIDVLTCVSSAVEYLFDEIFTNSKTFRKSATY